MIKKTKLSFAAKTETKDSPTMKFERMQMLATNNSTAVLSHITTTATPNTTSIDLTRVWNIRHHNDHNIPILNERCSANETTVKHACQLFEICVSNLTMLVEEVEVKLQRKSDNIMKMQYDPVHLHHTWYDFVTVQVAFYGGLFIGTIFGAIMLFMLKLISDCVMMSDTETEHRVQRKRSELSIA